MSTVTPEFVRSALEAGAALSDKVKAHAQAYDAVVTIARELVANVRCACHECWTGRDRHDPKGCTWEDIEGLRNAVSKLDEESTE
jgi:hypothetical protein